MESLPLNHSGSPNDHRDMPACGALRNGSPSTTISANRLSIPPPKTSMRRSDRRFLESVWRPFIKPSKPGSPSDVATKLTAGTGGNRARYDARRDLHYHFRCLRSGTVHDLPTRFDPDLIAKLDPRLHDDLSRQGFQVTGYRLELVGYQNGSHASNMDSNPAEADHAAVTSQAAAPPLATEARPSHEPGRRRIAFRSSTRMRIWMTGGSARTWKVC